MKSFAKKLFGGLDLSWPKLIVWALAAGLLVGGIMLIPGADRTSLKDIGTNFEWWIFFGTIIVANSRIPVDSAAKAFVFFLISQPLIYLVQVPFSDLGWGLFGYYKNWILWTLATIPMGAAGHFVRRGDVISSIILSAMTVFLAAHMMGYISTAVREPPLHLVSAVLCAVFIILMILGIPRTKYAAITAWGIIAAAIVVMTVIFILRGGPKLYSPTLNCKQNGIDVNSGSTVTGTIDISAPVIREVAGEYFLYVEISGEEGRISIETDGKEKTYVITYNKDTNDFTVREKSKQIPKGRS